MIVTKNMAIAEAVDLKDLWETPPEIFNPLNEEFEFTLDPCCTLATAKCGKCFTPFNDGLKETWQGERVYCNPPYSRGNIDLWVEKCYKESRKPNTVVVGLLPVSTSANWWHEWVWKKAELRFIKGRVKFLGAKHTAPFSSVIAIWTGCACTLKGLKRCYCP